MEIRYYLFGLMFLAIAIVMIYVTHIGYWSDPRGKKNKLFLLMGIAMIIWLLGEAGFWFSSNVGLILAFYHFKYIGIILIGTSYFLVANAVPIWRNILNKKWLYYLLFAIVGILEILCLTNPFTHIFFTSYFEGTPGKYFGKLGIGWWCHTCFQYTLLLGGIFSLLLSIRQARTRIEKSQAKILIFAMIFPGVGNVTALFYNITPDPTTVLMSFSAILLGYAISKYRLFTFKAETERAEPEAKIPFHVEHGYNYVIVDDYNNASYFLLRSLSTQKPGLCVTGKPPGAVRNAFKIEKLPILWITEVESEEFSANPERLEFEIAQSIINFMRENPGATVFIDDIEYLTAKCGFEVVSSFLKDIVDVASTTSSTFIAQIRPAFFEEEKRKMLTSIFDRELKLPEMKPEKESARTYLYYRKEDTLEQISTKIKPGEKGLVITRTHPRKVEKYFGKAEYYWITDLDINDVKTIKPEAVDTTFIIAIREAVKAGVKHIVIDGCDVVKLRIDFNRYLGFVKDLTDLAHKYNVNLYCVVEKSDEKENVAVSNRFDQVVS